jgi:hypothetical protein
MDFVIQRSDKPRESFAEYEYQILSDGKIVAKYWHDYRGDDHGIRFNDGFTEECPVGHMTDFITGGGPQPLGLSENAIAYLKKKLG